VAPVLITSFPWILEDADVNRAALSQLIIGAAAAVDAAEIALRVQLLLANLRARVWYEYVDSNANPSDVFSRDYEDDEEVTARIADGTWRWLGDADFSSLAAATFEDLVKLVATLGGGSSRLQAHPSARD
jgi:hypothetical protein